MKKLSTTCYIIRNVKTYMSATSLKIIYPFFHSVMCYRIIFWENSSHSTTIFSMQNRRRRKKEELEFRKDVGIEFHVNICSRNYKFCL